MLDSQRPLQQTWTFHRVVLILLAALLGPLAFAACGGDDDVATAPDDVCDALTDFRSVGLELQNLEPLAADVEDVEAATDDVRDAYGELAQATDELDEAILASFDEAIDDLASTIDDNRDLPVTDLFQIVLAQIQEINETARLILSEEQCEA